MMYYGAWTMDNGLYYTEQYTKCKCFKYEMTDNFFVFILFY